MSLEKELACYRALMEKIYDYEHALALLKFDSMTVMPPEGAYRRNRAIATISEQLYAMQTGDELYEVTNSLYESLKDDSKLPSYLAYSIKETKREFDELKDVPKELFLDLESVKMEADASWKKARAAEDYSLFKDDLYRIANLTAQVQSCKKSLKSGDDGIFDSLLSDCEPGMDTATYDRLFNDIKQELIPLIKEIMAKKRMRMGQLAIYGRNKTDRLSTNHTKYQEEEAQNYLLKYIGFDFNKGTTSQGLHPFTMGFSHGDARFLNNFHEDDCIRSMFSSIHEGGHAIFWQNVNPEFDSLPADGCKYAALNESQSRFFENILAHNIAFWEPIYDDISDILPGLKAITLDEFNNIINNVKPTYIRTSADELTYCLHIILRYEIEKEIFVNHACVNDLEDMWNEKTKEYLGIVPPKPSLGILQDMHWGNGLFGYFPTYLLGNVYDGMLLSAIERDLGSVDDILRNKEIGKITKYLNENIHYYGNTKLPKDTLKDVCHEDLTAKQLINYYKKKYNKLYDLNV